jgi:site-specific recombinase XerD
MTTELIILDDTLNRVPALISHSGEHTASACLEFFTAHIRNPNTRRAYARTLSDFSDWCSQHSLDLKSLKPLHVAAYIEQMTKEYEVVSVKQSLAAIRGLFDFMVVRHAPASIEMPRNP